MFTVLLQMTVSQVFNKDNPEKPAVGDAAAKVTRLPAEQKHKYDIAAVKWIVKSCRPQSITEKDLHLRDFLRTITGGRYSGPVASTVKKLILDMSIETRVAIKVWLMPACLPDVQ